MKFYFIIFFCLCSCASAPDLEAPQAYEKEFAANFEETWRALQQAIISYPLKINNMELGQVQTTSIRSGTQFKPPPATNIKAAGYRYSLTISLLKISPVITRVSILKDVMVRRDFISKPEAKYSDGFEENQILYRIQRELEIEKILLRDSKKKNKT